jgi:4-hydroxy-4-methyl-2-oxoglutarate aldolase
VTGAPGGNDADPASAGEPDEECLRTLGSAGVATVHEAYGRRGLMHGMSSIVPGSRMCGRAVTTLNHAGDNLMIHAALELCRPGDVLVVATTAPSSHGMFGDLLATLCRARGLAGVVIDAGVRDVAELRSIGLPIWSRHVSAAGTLKVAPGWSNVPVACAGTVVLPGDVVVGDEDGVVVVEAAEAARVARRSLEREAHEEVLRGQFGAGALSLDVLSLRGILGGR